jgi:hypothetical protein
MSLTEFSIQVIDQSLDDLANRMARHFGASELRQAAALVRDVTQGLPAQLNRALDWIEEAEWLALDQLANQETFDLLTEPYIEGTLFAQRSLLPDVREPADGALAVLRRALRLLVPHRQVTLSHLRYYVDQDPAFQAELDNIHWSIADLWEAVAGTSLLIEPIEPWREIESAIRRLLFRYYYWSDPQRVAAHNTALAYDEIFWARQGGTEQVVGLVDSLWHEATVVSIISPADMTERLTESARKRSLALSESAAFTIGDLRQYAAQRMAGDQELQEVFSSFSGLLDSLVKIVAEPRS